MRKLGFGEEGDFLSMQYTFYVFSSGFLPFHYVISFIVSEFMNKNLN